jgi:hypothetical protein
MKHAKTMVLRALVFAAAAVSARAGAVPVDPATTVTATMDGGTAKTGNTWYEVGVNLAAAATGIKTGIVTGQADPLSTYLFQSASALNTLLLDGLNKVGTFTFNNPLTVNGFTLTGSSGNGAGTVTPTVHFSNGTTSVLAPGTVGDWFNNSPRIQTVGGRISVPGNSFANVNADNPRILGLTYNLSPADSGKAISSISFDWSGGANTHTALFGISGDFTGLGHYSAIPLAAGSFNQDTIVGAAEVTATPEPGALALFGLGASALLLAARRQRA